MKRVVWSLVGSTLLLLPLSTARADDDRGPRGIPPGHLPSPGECRVWHDGRPPGHQPAPTDCATAHALAARFGGRVVYGADRDDWRERGRGWDRDDDRDDDWGDDDRDDWDDDDRRYGRERGRSEDRRGRAEELRCRDRNRDGWCDGSRYPVRLPEMAWGVDYSRGHWVPALGPWLQDAQLGVRFPRTGRRGLPREIVWFDRADRVVQRWLDLDGDGRAERVELFRGGAPWRVLRYR